MKRDRINNSKWIIVITFIFIIIALSGFNGCEAPTTKTGLDFSLVSGVGSLNAGRVIIQGDTFYVAVNITNYDKKMKSGQVCVRDDLGGAYGGISEECKTFSVKGAEIIESEEGGIGFLKKEEETVKPGIITIYFPDAGDYSYSNLPINQPANLFVTIRYIEKSQVEGFIDVPDPESEQLVLQQESAPIFVNIQKTVRRKEEAYKVDLAVNLIKKRVEAKIFSPGFEKENYLFFNAQEPALECKIGEETSGLIEFENQKFIKCSTLLYVEEQTRYPLVLTLDYGVQLEKKFPFTIRIE